MLTPEEILQKIEQLKSEGAKINDKSGMIHKIQLWMLDVMLERFEDADGRGFYDEETDFDVAWDNLCDELAEILKENKP
jgi:hypothetical protein